VKRRNREDLQMLSYSAGAPHKNCRAFSSPESGNRIY
jgi:hypothetical protein